MQQKASLQMDWSSEFLIQPTMQSLLLLAAVSMLQDTVIAHSDTSLARRIQLHSKSFVQQQ
jgi:hypothetical protein